VIFFFLGIGYAHLAPRKYEVTLLISQVQSQKSSAISSLLSRSPIDLGGFGDVGNTTFKLYLEALYAPVVIERVSKDPAIMHGVFAQQWDANANTWSKPAETSTAVKNAIKDFLAMPITPWHPPAGPELSKYIEDNVTLAYDNRHQLARLEMSTQDPQTGMLLLQKLGAEADQYLRQLALRRADAYVSYVSRELDRVTVADYREALINVLGEQEKLRMIAGSGVPYAAEPFGPAFASVRPVSPNVYVILPASFLIGVVVGSVLAILQVSILGRAERAMRKSARTGDALASDVVHAAGE
jgi:hypothetical protein